MRFGVYRTVVSGDRINVPSLVLVFVSKFHTFKQKLGVVDSNVSPPHPHAWPFKNHGDEGFRHHFYTKLKECINAGCKNVPPFDVLDFTCMEKTRTVAPLL